MVRQALISSLNLLAFVGKIGRAYMDARCGGRVGLISVCNETPVLYWPIQKCERIARGTLENKMIYSVSIIPIIAPEKDSENVSK